MAQGNITRLATKNSLAVAIAAVAASGSAQAAVLISSGATTNIACVSGVCTPTKKSAVLNITQLQSLLASGDVNVTTNGSLSADIVVNSAVSWASAHSLALDAYQSITVDKTVSVNGTGALNLVTDDGGAGGTLSFGPKGHITFLSTANSLTINRAPYTLVADTTTLASDIAAAPSGDFALASDYDASNNSSYVATTFTGNFEGLGNLISHLRPETSGSSAGFFARLGTGGAITNLRLVDIAMSAESQNVGSLVGWNEGYLAGDSTAGTLRVDGEYAGGLVGFNQGTIVSCYSLVRILGNDKHSAMILGGLVGSNNTGGLIGESYATGSVTSVGTDYDGGLIGLNEGAINNSYASGSISASNAVRVGGLIGANSSGTIVDSYSTGNVAGGSGSTIGGLVGADNPSNDITTSYWDTMTSGITNSSKGAGNISNDPGITVLSSAQLQAGLPAGFSSTIWGESPSINGGLPYLLANPPPK